MSIILFFTFSHSHSVFSITVRIKETTINEKDLLKIGKFNLIDLADLECMGQSGIQNNRKNGARNINDSTLTLGQCINALNESYLHIPIRYIFQIYNYYIS